MFRIKIHIFNAIFIIILTMFINIPQVSGATLFGPKQYIRTTGDPNIYEDTISAPTSGWEATLTVKNGASDGSDRVDKDDMDTLVSSAIVMLNGVEIFGPNDFSKNVYMLEADITLNETNILYVELRSQPDSYLTIEIVGADPPPTITFTADPEIITVGETATLSWTSTNATSCSISPDVGSVDLNGSITISPVQTTIYTLTATGPGGSTNQSLTIQVNQPTVSVNIEADPEIAVMGNCQLDPIETLITPMVIIPGTPVLISWTSSNADSCVIEPIIGNVGASGQQIVYLDFTTTFTITAAGAEGTATDQIVVEVIYCPTFFSISATPATIYRGIQSSTLSWQTNFAETVTIEPDIGSVDLSGSITVSPSETTVYTFTATNAQGYYNTWALTVTVADPPPTVSIEAAPEGIQLNGVSTLTWQSEYAETCVIEPDIGSVDVNGSIDVTPTETTTYTISAIGPGGTVTDSVSVVVFIPPTISITANPENILIGGASDLTWTTTNADTVSIDQGIGTVDASGTVTVTPAETTTYTLTAIGSGGTVTSDITIIVNNPFTLQITSPTAGTTIMRPDVMVEGTIINSDGLETGVTVNGVVAIVYGDKFIANHVPLGDGENTITVTATDTAGSIYSVNQTVYTEIASNYITVLSNLESGISPLEAILDIRGTFSFDNSNVSYSGPTPIEFLSNEAESYQIRINSEGIYYLTAEVTDAESNVYSDTIAIGLQNVAELNTLLKAKWNDMKAVLVSGDIESGLDYFLYRSKDRYRDIFSLMGDNLASIITDMQDIQMVTGWNQTMKYRIVRHQLIEGEYLDITYYIYFEKDSSGLWKIDRF